MKNSIRNQVWRRSKSKRGISSRKKAGLRREKNWKMMNFRSEKLGRGKQLGFDYLKKPLSKILDEEESINILQDINLLFICSRNKWRSPTAERVWKNESYSNTRSAGTSSRARRTVNAKDISWADLIFVMEQKHSDRLKASFDRLLKHKRVISSHSNEIRYS